MADTLRIKRRVTGSPGAPAGLANAELAYNEVDHVLYYGEGTGGAGGTASVIVSVGGQGLASSAAPTQVGAAAAGSASQWARGDHVHPNTAATAAPGTSTTQIATTAFVSTAISSAAGVSSWNTRTGAVVMTLADVTTVGGAPIASPTFTGTPAAPTPANGDSSTLLATTQFVRSTRLDQLVAPAVDLTLNNHKLINVLDPTNPQDAATKNYADGLIQGINAKGPVLAATAGANVTLSGPQTIDGVALVAGNRVLVKDQATPSANGIYVVAAGAWSRATDQDTWAEVPSAFAFVEQGTVNADSGWLCTSDPGGTIGTTAITWVQFSAAGQITAGSGLQKTGNTLNVVGTATRISVGAAVDIDAGYVGQTSITTLGTIGTGTWNATVIAVARGGSGATTLTGYLKGNGTSPFTATATVPIGDVTGLGTMAAQNANAVAITGGTIDGVTFDCGTF